MHRVSLLFRALVIVAFVAALGANSARAQTSQLRDDPAYGQQPQGEDQSTDQSAKSQNSDESSEDNPGARPDQDDSTNSGDSDQNNSDSNNSDSSEQENQ
jgi:hypothetical protein